MKVIEGKVESVKMDKTVVVSVVRSTAHPLYKKIIRRTKRYKVHNEDETISVGDRVKIVSCRPISKQKAYKILEKI